MFHGDPHIQSLGDLQDTPLSHTVGDQICPRIQQDGMFHGIRPVIVMGQPPQRSLDPAQDNGGILIGLPDQITVNCHSPIRSETHFSSRRISVGFPVLSGHCIVVDHGIHISGRHQKSKPGFSEKGNALFFLPVRLGNDPYRISSAF